MKEFAVGDWVSWSNDRAREVRWFEGEVVRVYPGGVSIVVSRSSGQYLPGCWVSWCEPAHLKVIQRFEGVEETGRRRDGFDPAQIEAIKAGILGQGGSR